MNGHLQKRLGCVQLNAFTGAHPLRSLTSAARPVLAVLRHIRSTVSCLVATPSNNTSSRMGFWAFYARIDGTSVPEMTSNTSVVHDSLADT